MTFQLTKEQAMFQKMAREFALKELAPLAGERDQKHEYPADSLKNGGAGFSWNAGFGKIRR